MPWAADSGFCAIAWIGRRLYSRIWIKKGVRWRVSECLRKGVFIVCLVGFGCTITGPEREDRSAAALRGAFVTAFEKYGFFLFGKRTVKSRAGKQITLNSP